MTETKDPPYWEETAKFTGLSLEVVLERVPSLSFLKERYLKDRPIPGKVTSFVGMQSCLDAVEVGDGRDAQDLVPHLGGGDSRRNVALTGDPVEDGH